MAADWRRDLLNTLGYKPTQENLSFLATWQRWEGGATNNNATYNWLNTTYGPGTPINGVGVKAFKSYKDGIHSIAATLMNGRYDDILKGFAAGDPYHVKPIAGLETWVSGSPTGNPGYAQKILGSYSGGIAPTTVHEKPLPMTAGGFDPGHKIADVLFADDPSFLKMLKTVGSGASGVPDTGPGQGASPSAPHGVLQLPTHWKGTHITDGLGWGTKTAEDIMGAAGTPVGAPESGTVLYFHPDGAQGGGSMEFRSDSGRTYWLGHLDNGVKAGTRVERGGVVAYISSRHPRPHVHIDVRNG